MFEIIWKEPPATLPYAGTWTPGEWAQFTQTMQLLLFCAAMSDDEILRRAAAAVPTAPVYPFARRLVLWADSARCIVTPEDATQEVMQRAAQTLRGSGLDIDKVPRADGAWEWIQMPSEGAWIEKLAVASRGKGIVFNRRWLGPSAESIGIYAHELCHWTQPSDMPGDQKEEEAREADRRTMAAYAKIAHPDFRGAIEKRMRAIPK